MGFPALFADALKLPTGAYYTPKLAHVRFRETMLVGMDGTAITNATSQHPVIGTDGFNPCCALILYNTKTKTAIVTHRPWPDGGTFDNLLSKVEGGGNSDRIEVHIIGGSIFTQRDVEDVDDPEGHNQMRVDYCTSILEAMAKKKSVVLKTFDVLDKPKPNAVAIDTRDGKLIRGSKLFSTVGEGERTRGHFDKWNCIQERDDTFDGTVPELQIQRRR